MIPSSKHGVKSNSLSVETGPHPSRWPWSVVLHVAIDNAKSNGTDASQGRVGRVREAEIRNEYLMSLGVNSLIIEADYKPSDSSDVQRR